MAGLKDLDKIPRTIQDNINYFQYVDKGCKVTSAVGALLLLHLGPSGRCGQVFAWAKSATNLRTYTFAGMGILSTTNIGKMAYRSLTGTPDKDNMRPTFSDFVFQLNLVGFHWAFVGARVTGMFRPTQHIATILGKPIGFLVLGLDAQGLYATFAKRAEGKKEGSKDVCALADDSLDIVSTALGILDRSETISLATGALSGIFHIAGRAMSLYTV